MSVCDAHSLLFLLLALALPKKTIEIEREPSSAIKKMDVRSLLLFFFLVAARFGTDEGAAEKDRFRNKQIS